MPYLRFGFTLIYPERSKSFSNVVLLWHGSRMFECCAMPDGLLSFTPTLFLKLTQL